LEKVLVANRGEIAVRVLRACRELGLVAVAVYSDADRDALHVEVADEAWHIGEATPAKSYLNIDALVDAARRARADAVHPGYGFLAESAAFAQAVMDAGLRWVGPRPAAIAAMGDKVAARRVAEQAKAPLVPGTVEPLAGPEGAVAFGDRHGYPLALKAAFGGGGRGMKVVRSAEEVAAGLESARRESRAAFGRDEIYVERYLDAPRHVEAQILADGRGEVVFLGERDCSLQRRHQKLVEEAPSPGLPEEVGQRLRTWAVVVAKACGYVGAGTVEFLWDPESGGAWFLEMNTRIQVEHPITEQVTGVDIVAAQLRVAAGEPLGISQDDVTVRGHAIECRINAEDPARGFLPTPGTITALRWPGGPGLRVDAGYEGGDTVPPYYDDLLGKLIAWAPDRDRAIARMRAALDELAVEGVATTAPALARVLGHDDFRAARHWTTWLEEALDLGDLAPASAPEPDADFQVRVGDRTWPVRLYRHRPRSQEDGTDGGGLVASPLAGTLAKVAVAPGQHVEKGELLAVVEAMKMETSLLAPFSGTVVGVTCAVGEAVAAGQVVVEVDAGGSG